MTIALSIDRILENIYALAAMDSYTRAEERPAVLGRGQAPALRRLITGAAARVIYAMAPAVTATNLSDIGADDDIVEINFDDAVEASGELYAGLRPLLESAVANAVMAAVWAPSSATLSDIYTTMYADVIALAGRTLALHTGTPGRLRPAV